MAKLQLKSGARHHHRENGVLRQLEPGETVDSSSIPKSFQDKFEVVDDIPRTAEPMIALSDDEDPIFGVEKEEALSKTKEFTRGKGWLVLDQAGEPMHEGYLKKAAADALMEQ